MENKNENTGREDDSEQEDTGVSEVLDFTNPHYEFIPKGSHEWTQRGYYLLCRSCDLEHAIWIGSDKLMVGISEDGQPILKDRSL